MFLVVVSDLKLNAHFRKGKLGCRFASRLSIRLYITFHRAGRRIVWNLLSSMILSVASNVKVDP
jgi:hypothetical protein